MLLNTSNVANEDKSLQTLDLQKLINELSKNRPDVGVVKRKTETLGIPYNPDLIVLMSEVLVYLSKNPANKKRPLLQSKVK